MTPSHSLWRHSNVFPCRALPRLFLFSEFWPIVDICFFNKYEYPFYILRIYDIHQGHCAKQLQPVLVAIITIYIYIYIYIYCIYSGVNLYGHKIHLSFTLILAFFAYCINDCFQIHFKAYYVWWNIYVWRLLWGVGYLFYIVWFVRNEEITDVQWIIHGLQGHKFEFTFYKQRNMMKYEHGYVIRYHICLFDAIVHP